MITRTLGLILPEMSKKYPIVGIMGPRQSGKTTLAKALFPDYSYVSIESPDTRKEAINDPRSFLSVHKPPVIFDELQNAPEIFSYLQEIVDTSGKTGQYVITGSQNFVLNEKISQTLAGRIYLAQLPTLTLTELAGANITYDNWEDYAIKGSYPRVYDKDLTPEQWYPGYIQTYLERDMRDLKNVADLIQFQTFMGFCAGRGGQELVITSIADQMGLSHNTIKAWLGLLEISQLVHLLGPYYKNLNKRLVKMPKLYFMDTGLMVYLLGISTADQLRQHPLRGSIFENLVASEILKSKANLGQMDRSYYIRDRNGNEVDYVEDRAGELVFTEIKASKTFSMDFLRGINYWKDITGMKEAKSFVVYTGEGNKSTKGTNIVNWKELDPIIKPPVWKRSNKLSN
ncbi:hypothetical protein A2709_03145 [candidate division WWE3 bacterium RIFCSPHIGHO2_01_FULL_43_9]|nr:MAG: hypothetical protein A2709_03145 [candidate division WWE3 bacterium RIFCSPHIGHO2_01_FULL_43_9]